jgi:RHS repeat-associated protein
VFGPGTDEPIVSYNSSGAKSWLVSDERGSIVAITTATGAKSAINGYDEYGLPDGDAQGHDLDTGRFRYTGQVWLSELGVYYYKNRIYSPTLGRFLQTDPIGYGDGINWYAYSHNDPVNGSDPLGLQDVLVTSHVNQVCSGDGCWFSTDGQNNGTSRDRPWYRPAFFGHSYQGDNQICRKPLPTATQAELLRRGSVPGHVGERLSNGSYYAHSGFLPGGIVTTNFRSDYRQVTNVTTALHFFVGSVTRTIYSNSSGTYIHTEGSGSAGFGPVVPPLLPIGILRDSINQAFGKSIFDGVDKDLADLAKKAIPGC